jgi:hypothetical protein
MLVREATQSQVKNRYFASLFKKGKTRSKSNYELLPQQHDSMHLFVEYGLNRTNIWKEADCYPKMKGTLSIFARSCINNIYYPTRILVFSKS